MNVLNIITRFILITVILNTSYSVDAMQAGARRTSERGIYRAAANSQGPRIIDPNIPDKKLSRRVSFRIEEEEELIAGMGNITISSITDADNDSLLDNEENINATTDSVVLPTDHNNDSLLDEEEPRPATSVPRPTPRNLDPQKVCELYLTILSRERGFMSEDETLYIQCKPHIVGHQIYAAISIHNRMGNLEYEDSLPKLLADVDLYVQAHGLNRIASINFCGMYQRAVTFVLEHYKNLKYVQFSGCKYLTDGVTETLKRYHAETLYSARINKGMLALSHQDFPRLKTVTWSL